MEIKVLQELGQVPVTVFQVEGRINLGSADELQLQAESTYDTGARDLLIDLSGVQSLTSAGLRAIHAIYKLYNGEPTGDKSTHFKLLSPPDDILKVITIAGLDAFIEIYDDLQSALASY